MKYPDLFVLAPFVAPFVLLAVAYGLDRLERWLILLWVRSR